MGRKKDVPFKRGKLKIWLQQPYTSSVLLILYLTSLLEPYVNAGTKNSTVSNKAIQIREMFD